MGKFQSLLGVSGAAPATGGGDVEFDAVTTQTTSESYSHTTSGSNRALFLLVQTNAFADASATYNGVSMTKIADESVGILNLTLFVLANPASGSNTVSISTIFGTILSQAVSFENVDQTTSYSNYGTDSKTGANSNDLSVTVNSVGTSDMAFDGAIGDGGTYSPNSGQTEIANQDTGFEFLGSSYEVGTGGNMTQNWTRPFFSQALMFALRINNA